MPTTKTEVVQAPVLVGRLLTTEQPGKRLSLSSRLAHKKGLPVPTAAMSPESLPAARPASEELRCATRPEPTVLYRIQRKLRLCPFSRPASCLTMSNHGGHPTFMFLLAESGAVPAKKAAPPFPGIFRHHG